MKKTIALFCSLAAFANVNADWYWPFGDDKEEEKEKPRLSVLMEPASLLIDDASDLAMDGKATEAIAKYREALVALDKVEAENPDRARSPEFATLRNKRAYVNAAMDSIILAQARQNAKSVAVSDTTELEKKFAEEKAETEKKGEKAPVVEKKPVPPKTVSEKNVVAEKPSQRVPDRAAPDAGKPESGETSVSVPAPKPSAGIAEKVPSAAPESKREQAIRNIRSGDYDAAMLVIDEMLAEKPNGAAALNLRAVCQVKQGLFKDAEKTLDRAIRSNPRDFNAYYNMAYLVLQTKRDEGKNIARRYYETGRAFGGPVDENLKEAVR